MQSQRISHLFRLLLSLILLLTAVYIFVNRQYVLDQYHVWQYNPSASISAINDRASLNEKGNFLFYATRPELLEREAFNNACRSVSQERTAILGCYSASRIYLFDIEDQRLDGIREVTAVHEMLHAAYERLPQKEKNRVNNLLDRQDLGEDTDRINELMAEYAKSEPGEEYNELHSMIGSEIDSLSPDLENYYRQYFKDRASVVSLSDSYQTVFDGLKAKQDGLVQELNVLADSVDSESATYRRNLQVLESDIKSFNASASGGSLSRQEYESQRRELEARQSSLRRQYNTIQSLIVSYEKKRTELETINSESTALNRSINSSLSPVPEGING